MKKQVIVWIMVLVMSVSLGACANRRGKEAEPMDTKETIGFTNAGDTEETVGATGHENLSEHENSAQHENSVQPAAEIGRTGEQSDTKADLYPVADSYNGTLSRGINRFAYNLAERLNEQGEEENYFFSPYSLCAALTLLSNAAAGDTLSQMNDMMGIASLEDWNQQMGLFMKQEQPEDAYLLSANSLWLAKDYEPPCSFYDTYCPLVSSYFDAALFEADYKNAPEIVVQQMNRWISENTEGMLPDCVEKVNEDTVLTLMNASYFYGEWKYAFTKEGTRKRIFTCGDEEEITVDMMNQGGIYLKYLSKDGIHAVSMPYGDGSKVMNILVQKTANNVTAQDIFGAYTAEEKDAFLHALMTEEETKITTLSIPKFSLEYCIEDLPKLLEKLGMADAFYYPDADLPHISSEAYVSDISHTAKIEVDELGSKAAAVTIIETLCGSTAIREEQTINFIVNRPFLFFIQDVESEVILFAGQVNYVE